MEPEIILFVLLIINVLTFAVYAWDKHVSKLTNARRIPEKTLLLWAAFGGSIGALAAMYTLRHKTLHKKFTIGVPVILIIQIILTAYFLYFK